MCDSEHLFKLNKKDQNFKVFFTVMKQALQLISTYDFGGIFLAQRNIF